MFLMRLHRNNEVIKTSLSDPSTSDNNRCDTADKLLASPIPI
jgi:hypothetical protein